MKILFLTPGHSLPSSRFRVGQFVPYLRQRGHQCVVAPSRPDQYGEYRAIGWRLSQRLRRALREWDLKRAQFGGFDLVFLERELFNDPSVDYERRFQKVSGSMVLDLDDAIWLNHPGKVEAIAQMCDGVIAGNRFLASWLGQYHRHVTLIPTCVDLARYVPQPKTTDNPLPVIGWTGSSSNLPYLEALQTPLRALAKLRQFELRIIADDIAPLRSLDLEGVNVRFVRWSEQNELEELRQFDIGLMPLQESEWSRGKCGFKIIQYMALAIPAVASPVGVNREIITEGTNGRLCDSPEAWQSTLQELLDHPDLRAQLGAEGRSTIEQHYSVQANLPKLEAALEQACQATRR
jgi:glycosyltransferase involved in cell wall biosynthesis